MGWWCLNIGEVVLKPWCFRTYTLGEAVIKHQSISA